MVTIKIGSCKRNCPWTVRLPGGPGAYVWDRETGNLVSSQALRARATIWPIHQIRRMVLHHILAAACSFSSTWEVSTDDILIAYLTTRSRSQSRSIYFTKWFSAKRHAWSQKPSPSPFARRVMTVVVEEVFRDRDRDREAVVYEVLPVKVTVTGTVVFRVGIGCSCSFRMCC